MEYVQITASALGETNMTIDIVTKETLVYTVHYLQVGEEWWGHIVSLVNIATCYTK